MKSFPLVLSIALLTSPLLAAPALAQVHIIEPGVELFATPAGSGTSIGFADDPIPADFFCPGSPEFTGTIYLRGKPLVTDPPHIAGTTDCIVERLEAVPASGGTTAIAIRALNLKHQEVLTIDCDDTGPTNFGLRVNLDPAAESSGASYMEIYPDSFSSYLEVPALLKFYDVDNDVELTPIPHQANLSGSGVWSATPGSDAVEIEGPFAVDTDGDNVADAMVPGTTNNFFVGWQGGLRWWIREWIKLLLHRFLPPIPWVIAQPIADEIAEPIQTQPLESGLPR